MIKYAATCVDDEEEITHCGIGASPDAACKDFMENGAFQDQCSILDLEPGTDIDVHIYKIEPLSIDAPEMGWVLDGHVETRKYKSI